jgi:hypothetical protein
MDWTEFIAYIKAWAVENEEKIGTMWPQKGGWEEWAKGEIFSYIVKQRPAADILREQHCWGDQREADYVLNINSHASQVIVVEFKAQSFENYTKFLPGLKKDVQKTLSGLTPKYASGTLLVVGLYFTRYKSAVPNYFTTETLGTGEVGICYAMDQQ